MTELQELKDQIEKLRHIIALQDQYINAVLRDDNSIDLRIDAMMIAINEYEDSYNMILGVEP